MIPARPAAARRPGTGRPGVADCIRLIHTHLETDLLCYRSPEPTLSAAQHAAWDEWIHWFGHRHGVVLTTTTMLSARPPVAGAFVRRLADRAEPVLGTLAVLCRLWRSTVLACAVIDGALSPWRAHDLACLEERLQEQRYRVVEEDLAPRLDRLAEAAAALYDLHTATPSHGG